MMVAIIHGIFTVLVSAFWASLLTDRKGFLKRVPNLVILAITVIPLIAIAINYAVTPLPIWDVSLTALGLLGFAFLPRISHGLKWCLAVPTQYSNLRAYFWETKIKVEYVQNKDNYDIIYSTQYEATKDSWGSKIFQETRYEEIR